MSRHSSVFANVLTNPRKSRANFFVRAFSTSLSNSMEWRICRMRAASISRAQVGSTAIESNQQSIRNLKSAISNLRTLSKEISIPIEHVCRRQWCRARAARGERPDHHHCLGWPLADDLDLRRAESGRQPRPDRRAPLCGIASEQPLQDRAGSRARRIAVVGFVERPFRSAHADDDVGARAAALLGDEELHGARTRSVETRHHPLLRDRVMNEIAIASEVEAIPERAHFVHRGEIGQVAILTDRKSTRLN